MANLNGLYYPFGIIQGETFEFSFEFYIDGLEQYFDEFDFVGQVKDKTNNMVSVANLTFTESEEASNIIDVSIPADDTSDIQTVDHLYEIRCTNKETGVVTVLFYGPFTIKQSLITQGAFGAAPATQFVPPVIPM